MIPPRKSRFADPLQQIDRTCVLWKRRKLAYFGGCDYFRLSSDPRILRAVKSGLAKYGLNVAASRRTTGNHRLYEQIEQSAARFFAAESAVLVSNGYLTNIVAAQALRGTIAVALIDDRAHASLHDAAQVLRCPVKSFRHRDYSDAARKFASVRSRGQIALLTDGLFANDGSPAPLREYRQAIGEELLLWVDDSHAAGVLGRHGRGSLEHAELIRHNVVQTVTFSKAFGVYGGAVLSDSALAAHMTESSGALIGNTPLPLPLAAAVLEALKILRASALSRTKLRRNVALFWSLFGAEPPPSPIVALTSANPGKLRRDLLAEGIYPSFIQYPGGPANGYFRFSISSEHTHRQIKTLAKVLASADILVER